MLLLQCKAKGDSVSSRILLSKDAVIFCLCVSHVHMAFMLQWPGGTHKLSKRLLIVKLINRSLFWKRFSALGVSNKGAKDGFTCTSKLWPKVSMAWNHVKFKYGTLQRYMLKGVLVLVLQLYEQNYLQNPSTQHLLSIYNKARFSFVHPFYCIFCVHIVYSLFIFIFCFFNFFWETFFLAGSSSMGLATTDSRSARITSMWHGLLMNAVSKSAQD